MPSLEEIRDLETTSLDDLERELIRQILNITGKAGTATYIESEVRMNLLTPSQNQIIRGLLLDYEDIQFDTTYVSGGSSGTSYNPQRDKQAIASELRRMLYPGNANENIEEQVQITLFALGQLQMVPVEYKIGSNELS